MIEGYSTEEVVECCQEYLKVQKGIGKPDSCHKGSFDMKMRQHMASRKDLLDGPRDLLSFHVGITDPTYSSRGVPVNLTLQLTKRES